MKYQFLSILLISIFLLSCNSRKAEEKEADKRLKQITELIANNSYNVAKIQIDSIHILFPQLVKKRKLAVALEDTVILHESSRNLLYCDSILPLKINEAKALQKNFSLEKDTKYQEFGNFIYKTQRTEINSSRCYLKAYVNENADFYLISNYTGTKIEQYAVSASVNDLFAKTDSFSVVNSNFHSFNDGGSHWETLTFKNEQEKGISNFISQYKSEHIKITLLGKKNYVYYLDVSDKKAIAETYNLWIVMTDIDKLQKEIKKSQNRINRINRITKK